MKKRIKKREYNTETAKRVASYTSRHGSGDFDYYYEELYRKTSGEFFLYGFGNAATRYAKPVRDGMGSGEDITPLTYDEAEEWAERHISADECNKIFGEPEEDGKSQCTFSLSRNSIAKLKKMAAIKESSISDVLDGLIIEERF